MTSQWMPMLGMSAGAIGGAVAASAIAVSRGAPDVAPAIFAGMIGPLVAALGTWVLVTRTYQRNPAGLTSVMMAAFGAKAVFFAAYCIGAVQGFDLDVRPFGLSFASFFIALYVVEAVLMARLFRRAAQETR